MTPNNETKLFYLAIGKNIRKYRDIRNYSLQDLGERVDVTKKTIQRYENGEIKIDMNRLADIAEALGVGMDKLLEGTYGFLGIDIEDVEMLNIPIVGKISCGNGVFAYEEIESYEPTPKKWLNGDEYFYTRVHGDSMINARIHEGDLVLIRKQSDVDNGDIAAVVIDDVIFLKRIYKQNGTVVLQSENPNYAPIVIDSKKNNCYIVGKLKKIIVNI